MTRANTTREGLTITITVDNTSSNHSHDAAATALSTTCQTASSTTPQRPRVFKHATPRLIDTQPPRSTYRLSLSHAEQPPCLAKPAQHVKIPSHPHHTHTLQPRKDVLGQADPLHSVSTLEVGGPAREQ